MKILGKYKSYEKDLYSLIVTDLQEKTVAKNDNEFTKLGLIPTFTAAKCCKSESFSDIDRLIFLRFEYSLCVGHVYCCAYGI